MSTRYVWDTYNVTKKEIESNHDVTFTGYMHDLTKKYWAAVGNEYTFSNGLFRLSYGYKWLSFNNPAELDINAKNYKYIILADSDRNSQTPVGPNLHYNKYQDNYSQNLYWVYLFKNQASGFAYYNLVLVQANDVVNVNINNYTSYAKQIDFHTTKQVDAQGSSSQGKVSSGSKSYPDDGVYNKKWYVFRGQDSIDPVSIEYSKTGDIYGGEKITVTVNKDTPTYGGTVYYLYQYSIDGKTWENSGEKSSSTNRTIIVPEGAKSFQVRVQASDNYGFTSTTYVYGTTLGVQNLKMYQGVSNKSRTGEKLYFGVNGKSREVIKAYYGVNGKSKSFL